MSVPKDPKCPDHRGEEGVWEKIRTKNIHTIGGCKCSRCGFKIREINGGWEFTAWHTGEVSYNKNFFYFCPRCGASMHEEPEEER